MNSCPVRDKKIKKVDDTWLPWPSHTYAYMCTCVHMTISVCTWVCACTCTRVCILICTNGVSREFCFFCFLFINFKELDDVIMEVSWIQRSSAGVRLRLKKEFRFENTDCLLTGLLLGLDWAGRISVCFTKAYTDCMKLTSIYLGHLVQVYRFKSISYPRRASRKHLDYCLN